MRWRTRGGWWSCSVDRAGYGGEHVGGFDWLCFDYRSVTVNQIGVGHGDVLLMPLRFLTLTDGIVANRKSRS
jgi:hypothetical protein